MSLSVGAPSWDFGRRGGFCLLKILRDSRDHWRGPDADGRIILRWIIRKCEGVVRTGLSWLRIETVGGHL